MFNILRRHINKHNSVPNHSAMKTQIILFIFILFTFNTLLAQDVKKDYKLAETFLYDENFENAIPLYENLLNLEPENPDYNFKLGFCYLNTHLGKEKSLFYIEKAVELMQKDPAFKDNLVDANFYLARSYHVNYQDPFA